MTKVSYVITRKGIEVPSAVYTSYNEVNDAVKALGNGYGYKVVYTEFDPEDTPERREQAKKHAKKVAEHLKLKRAGVRAS